MKTAALLETPALQATAANILPILAAALLCICTLPGYAGQNTGQFSVTVNLQNPNGTAAIPPATPAPFIAFCRSGTMVGTFGSTMTVVCTTGVTGVTGMTAAPTGTAGLPWTTMPDNTYRFMFSAYREGEQFRTLDSYSGAGTAASWRMIKLNDRDYMEMMLHW
jgi:hypothetical protein